MAVFKATQNRSDSVGKFKATEKRSYDSALVSQWEASSRESYDALEKYRMRINMGGFLSSDDLTAYRSALDTYKESASNLRRISKSFGQGGTDDDDQWNESLSQMESGYKGISDYYSQWKNEADFKVAMEQVKANEKRLEELTGGYDPAKNQQEGKAGWEAYMAQQEKYAQMNKEAMSAQEDPKWWEQLLKYIGDIGSDTSLPGIGGSQVAAMSKEAQQKDLSLRSPDERWTDEQRETFGYLWNTDRPKANEYAFTINSMLNKQAEDAKIKDIQESATGNFFAGAGHTLGSIAAAPLGLADYLGDLIYQGAVGYVPKADGEITPFEYSQAVTGGVSQHLNEVGGTLNENIPVIGGKGWGDVYGLGTSIAQSSLAAYSGGSGQALITFFGSAAASGVDDALSRGASGEQAIAYGTLSGLAEGLAENIGVDNLLSIGASNTMRQLVMNILKQGAAEGLEEGATTLMNNFADQLVMQDKSQFSALVQRHMLMGLSESDAKKQAWMDMANDLAFDMVSGFASGAIHAGPQTAYQTYLTGNEMKANYGGFQQELVGEALEIDPNNAFAQKMQGRLDRGKKLSGGQLAQLVEQNNAAITAQDMSSIQSATESRLTELGETGDISTIAAALTKQAAGEKLSRAEQQAIASSKYGQRVSNELNPKNIRSGAYSSAWAEQIDTNRINAQEYSRLVEDTQPPQEDAEVPGEQVAGASPKTAQEPQAEPVEATIQENQMVDKTGENSEIVDTASEATVRKNRTVAEDGVTRQVSTGQAVEPKKIVSIDGGKAMIQTDSGTVAADDIEFGDGDTDLLWRSAVSFNGITPASANGVIRAYRSEDNVTTYLKGAAQEFRNGYYNMDSGGEYADKLTPAQREIIYELGQKAAGENTARAQAKATEAKKVAVSKKEITTSRQGKVHFDRNGRTFDAVRETALRTMEQLSAAMGVEFHVFESYKNSAGELVYKDANGNEVKAPNGYYDPKDGSIHIDLNAGADGKGTMLFTIAHELTHFIKQWSPAKFKVLANVLMKQYAGKHISVNELVDKQISKAQKNGRELSWEEAYEEVVADSMEAVLTDGNVVQFMAEVKQQDKTLWQKICDWFKDLVADLKAVVEAYKGYKPDSQEGRMVAQMQETIEMLERAYAEALLDAGDNYQASARTQKNTTENGGVKQVAAQKRSDRIVDQIRTHMAEIMVLDSVYTIDASNATPYTSDRKTDAKSGSAVFKAQGGVANRSGFGRVVLSNRGAVHTIYHGNGPAKQAAFPAIKAVIEQGIEIYRDNNHDDRGYDTITFAAPITFFGSESPLAVVVKSFESVNSDKTFYIHEICDAEGNYIQMAGDDSNKKTSSANFVEPTSTVSAADDGIAPKDNVAQDAEIVKNESAEAVGIDVDDKTESVAPSVMFSERTWTESDYVRERNKAAKEIANAIGVSEKRATDYIDSVNSIAKMIAEDRSRLDYFSSPGRSSFVGNVEYGGSFDFSTLCKKRRLLTGTFTAIQKALPNTALTADEILDIRNRMKAAGLEVSCGLCYVEGSRSNMGQFAKEFLKLYKQYYPDAWQPNMADVNTPDGIEWVRINHPEVYEQYEYFWNHYGTLREGDKNLFASQQKPKLYQLHTEYKGEILEKFNDDDNVEEKNLNGGIRLQSFSDFEIVHLIDTMQIIMDMARVGLAGQAYTKVPDFAWALGDTGLKINLSLIAKGVDENGKLIFDDVEGMPIDTAVKLRDRYSKNVGTILVAFNDEQLLAAMADDRVDFIIPFHRSQWKKSQYGAMGLPAKTKDYTYMQNEKYIKPQYHEYRGRMVRDKATNYMPNEYWDFSKSGKENAEAYLEMCARNNKRPKFYKLLQDNGDGSYSLKADGSTDGYWKLLIDFKMYDNAGVGSPQMPVKPEFNMDEATRMLNEYSGGHSNFPVAQGIVDDFVKEYKDSHKGVKYSERDPEFNKVNRVLAKENTELKQDIAYLKELLKLQKQVTGGTKFTKTSVEAEASQLMKHSDAKGEKKELASLLNGVYEYIAKGETLTWEGVKEAAQPAVDWLQTHMDTEVQPDGYSYDEELLGQDLLRQVYDSYWNVSTLYTVADKAQKEINRLKYEHSKRMSDLREYHKEKVAQLKSEHREALQRVKQVERERSERKQQEIAERYQEAREKSRENRQKAQMRQKIRRTIMDLDKLLNRGNKKLNVKEDMQDLVAQALKAANILFTDTYTREDMVRSGVGTELTEQEAKYMAAAREILAEIENLPSGSYEAFQERQEEEARLKGKLAYRLSKLQDVFARERARLNKTKVSEVLGDLADAYASLENSEYNYVSGAFHENVHQYLLTLKSDVGGTTVKDMSLGQLEELHKAYTMVLTTVRNANKMFAENLKQTREQLGNRAIFEVKQAGGEHGLWGPGEDKINAFFWNNQKPVYAFEHIGSSILKKLFENTRAGEDTWAQDMTQAREYYLEQKRKYKYDTWDLTKQYKFTSSSGIDFTLNLEQIMSLYAYSKRKQAHDHLLKGGFVFDSNTEVQVNKMGIKVTYLNKTAKAHNVSMEILGEIVSKLNPEQRAFVDEMQDYLSNTIGGKGNEVSMQLYGVELFKEKHYFPLRSAWQYMERAKEADLKKEQGQISIVNSGFAKATTPKSSNPVVLSGFMDVWASHVNEMSMYHGFVLPMEDFRRVYNYSSPNMEGGQSISVNSVIQDAYGKEATDYIDQLYRDLNGGAVSDPRDTPIKALIGKFKKASVFASLSVVVQQPSAIGRAFAEIDPKYFIGSKVDSKRHKALWAELKRYAPVAAIKEMGYFDTGMGKSAQDFIKSKEYSTIKEKAAALFTDENYRDELLSKGPALADELTWCTIWDAVKRETKAKNPGLSVTSEEFLTEAGKRFTEVVTKTQVYDSVLSRSANMRSKGLMTMWTAFMAEPTTTINMVEDALRKIKRGDKKAAARVMGAVLSSVILNSMLVSLVRAMRDDDEDETFLEKYTQSFATEILDGINPLTYYPFLKDIWSALQGFDIERSDMSLITSLTEALTKLVRVYSKDTDNMSEEQLEGHSKNLANAWWNVVDYVTALAGIPVKNVRRDINGAVNLFKTIGADLDSRDTTWGSLMDKTLGDVKNSLPVVGWLPDDTAADKLYKAIVSGDTAYRKRLASSYATEAALTSAIRKGLRNNDPRIHEAAQAKVDGNFDVYRKLLSQIQGEGKFDNNDIISAIKSEESEIRKAK